MKYILLFLLISCATNKVQEDMSVDTTLPLYERGLSEEIRQDYLRDLGKDFYPITIREAFREGRVVNGMDKGMVKMLYGYPNKAKKSSWIYISDTQSIIVKIKFKSDTVFSTDFQFK